MSCGRCTSWHPPARGGIQIPGTVDEGAYHESILQNDCESILTKGYESILWMVTRPALQAAGYICSPWRTQVRDQGFDRVLFLCCRREGVFGLACFSLWQIRKIPVLRFLLMLPATDYDVWFLLLERSRWRQGALHARPQILQRTTGWDGCGPFLSDLQTKAQGIQTCLPQKISLIVTTSFAFRKYMARTSSFRLFKCWLLKFVYLVLFFPTMKMREDRLSAFTGAFYLKRLL